MTYNEWRDELKSNLLCVSESERRRVLDYYAEAYADRRDAGFTEREIIEDFGAPYDAAQRILSGRAEAEYFDSRNAEDVMGGKHEERQSKREDEKRGKEQSVAPPPQVYGGQTAQNAHPQPVKKPAPSRDDAWIFVLLCVIFAAPLFGLVITMVCITVSFCVAPFAVLIGGAAIIGEGIGVLFTSVGTGVCYIGLGFIIFGAGVALIPLFIKLVGLMWKLFTMFFKWLKSLFSGKEAQA